MAASNLPRHQVSRRDDAGRSFAFASYLRVAAMSGVVLIHTLSGIVGNPAIRFSATWWAGTALDLGSSWAVPVFIMVSGALLLESRPGEGARTFYARRLQRIAIPLVVAHVGYLLVRFRWLHEPLTVPLITPLLRSALAARTRGELLVIGVAGIGFMWAVRAGAQILALAGAPTAIWQPAALTLFIPYIGYFIIGYALRDVVLGGRNLLGAIGVFVTANALVVWQYAIGAKVPALAVLLGGGYQGLPVALTAVSIFVIGRSLVNPASRLASPPFQAPMRRLGELSLGVFIIHLLLLRFGWMTPSFRFSVVKQNLPLALLLWAVVTIGSFAVCAVIARIPIIRKTIGF